jgi:redox-sensitive bicupin YhaK (pirin superfamily)
MTAPRYQDVTADAIPEVTDDDGTRVLVIIGNFWGQRGPVEGIAADPRYLDVAVPPGKRKTLPVEMGRSAFAYVFEGSGTFRDASGPQAVMTERTDGSNLTELAPAGDRSLVPTKSQCRLANTASDFCSCLANRCRNRSRGTAPS